jgi:uncharacterized membrane protein
MHEATTYINAPEEVHARGSYEELARWGTASTGVALLAYGLARRSVPGLLLASIATPIAYKGLTGRWPSLAALRYDEDDLEYTRDALAGERGIHVRESIRLEKPIDEVYRFWRQFDNLPRFMTYLERVADLGGGRSHWVAKGPAGVHVEWDAEIINEIENKLIGWRSLPGSDVVTAGSVNFDTVRDGRSTQVTVHLQYAPPAGKVGGFVATLAGREPSQTIREDLRRLKQLLEAGEVATAEWHRRSQR